MIGWGNHWEPGEWAQELRFKVWQQSEAAALVLLELATIGLEGAIRDWARRRSKR